MTDREATYSQLLTETTQEKNILGIYETSEVKTYTYGIGLLSEKRKTNFRYISLFTSKKS